MKKINSIITVLFFAIAFTSCKKFLDVEPRTQMREQVLFETEGGFKDALTGVYIQMKNNNTYGGALTQTTIEYLTGSWDVTAATTEQLIAQNNYTAELSQNAFNSIWVQQYTTIASINAILSQIDQNKGVFRTPKMYEMIKSECLALRAYLHFDILRLFGPVPTATANATMLPYVTTVSKSPTAKISYQEFKDALFKDITEAENLYKNDDPIVKYSIAQLRTPSASNGFNPTDNYFAFRYLRMNYYAIKGLQARMHLWFNEKNEAYTCAKIVIDAKDENSTSKFKLGTLADLNNFDYVFSSEHLFGLYDFDMVNKFTARYASGTLKKGAAITTNIKPTLFLNTGTDIRESNMWEQITLTNGSNICVIRKYKANSVADLKQIPMLRLSEMYFIAAECAPLAEGIEIFKEFRKSRNIETLSIPTSATTLNTELLKEYRKELYAEGQSFFAYKRLNSLKAAIIFSAATTVNYVIPVPKSEDF